MDLEKYDIEPDIPGRFGCLDCCMINNIDKETGQCCPEMFPSCAGFHFVERKEKNVAN